MSQDVWYIYQNREQQGPFDEQQVKQMLAENMIAQDAHLFKSGWKDWRPLSECRSELGLTSPQLPPPPPTQGSSQAFVERSPRATVSGRVIIHNNGQLVIGSGANISVSGLFLQTGEQIFTIGEDIKLTCKLDSLQRPFHATATVVRFAENDDGAPGYGFKFVDLDPSITDLIGRLVEKKKKKQVKQVKDNAS